MHTYLAIWQNRCFVPYYHSRIKVLQIAQLLATVIFVTVPLVRENLRGLRENLFHKILSPARPLGGCHGTLDDAKRHNGLAAHTRIQ